MKTKAGRSAILFFWFGAWFWPAHAAEPHPICNAIPAMKVCTDPPPALTAETAKDLLDAEFEAAVAKGRESALSYARIAFTDGGFTSMSPAYIHVRDMALRVTPHAGSTVDKFYYLLPLGYAAFAAGDKETALQTVRQRLDLVRNWPEPGEDDWWDSKERYWTLIAMNAARFGELDLALSIVDEAHPIPLSEMIEIIRQGIVSFIEGRGDSDVKVPPSRNTLRYHLDRAIAYYEAGKYTAAEAAARRAAARKPRLRNEKRDFLKDLNIEVQQLLVQSLAQQGKSYTDEMAALRYELAGFPTTLRDHAWNFFNVTGDIARADLTAGRELMAHAQAVRRADPDAIDLLDTEASTCIEIKDDECARAVIREMESLVDGNEDDNARTATVPTDDEAGRIVSLLSLFGPPDASDVAIAYAWVGDLDASKKWMAKANKPGCYPIIHSAIMRRIFEDEKLDEAQRWLQAWTQCEVETQERSGHLHLVHWSWIVENYARLSRELIKKDRKEEALHYGKSALLLTIELGRNKTDWPMRRPSMLSASYGALTLAEQ